MTSWVKSLNPNWYTYPSLRSVQALQFMLSLLIAQVAFDASSLSSGTYPVVRRSRWPDFSPLQLLLEHSVLFSFKDHATRLHAKVSFPNYPVHEFQVGSFLSSTLIIICLRISRCWNRHRRSFCCSSATSTAELTFSSIIAAYWIKSRGLGFGIPVHQICVFKCWSCTHAVGWFKQSSFFLPWSATGVYFSFFKMLPKS